MVGTNNKHRRFLLILLISIGFGSLPTWGHMLHQQAKSPDFNGNGEVDFPDFVAFAGAFGSSDSTYDLDGSGTVDFTDFLTFAASFGKSVDNSTGSGTGSGNALANQPDSMAAAFALYPKVATRYDDTYFYVESNGIPDHQMMVNITAWIAQVPLPQPYTGDNAWSVPLQPEYADTVLRIEDQFHQGAIGIAANGIPIFNPLNASGLVSKDIGELDDFGGHSGRADDYHYHTAPIHLEATSGLRPIAYAFDGFPVYGSKEPDGSPMKDLDSYHGHEAEDGSYHYHGTDTFPFMLGAMRGKVSLDPRGTAPQTQILPQARTEPLRDPPHPINGDNLIITNLTLNSSNNGYLLEYTIGGVAGSVDYQWDDNGLYTFVFHDVNGQTSTETFNGAVVTAPTGSDTTTTGTGGGTSTTAFTLTSPAVENGAILDAFKCERKAQDGTESSIPLAWTNVPANTGALAITMHHFPNPNDTDPARANSYLVLWDIDPSVTEIAHGAADDGSWFMGSNKDGNAISYTSPCSPNSGNGEVHEYTITIYALSETPVSLPKQSSLDVTLTTLLSAIETVTVIDKATLTFTAD